MFVDASGRRKRILRLLGICLLVACAIYLTMVVLSLTGVISATSQM